ncbi:hypothetical protein BABINDRAFT_10061 [Babjeviella inositovora NRRL Y-12698]|uniref:Uncharacterized protein n=1 Tax=Babjeviella inositovora NRRL Y-12698 TaxID=984486 RepID=A0A1E3QJG3_9ASCO|nr:uncharacterized protein BABINDRAFT_10061 [Babjeviella inositovora NRRL Y-12698]ODQ77738.1 hypothetical protein BABINDRAFT_10061 [Babjeviella inositovora NRRL Y-12698]
MPNQTSSQIAESYLLSAQLTTFSKLLPYAKFAKLFPRATNPKTIDLMYKQLARLKEEQFERVRALLSRDFAPLVSVQGYVDENPFTDRTTIESVNAKLEQLCKQLEYEISSVEAFNAKLLEAMNMSVDELNDLRYGKYTSQELVQSTNESLDRLEEILAEKLP